MRDERAFKWLNESELGYDIWEKKYRTNNESFDEWLDRVSGGDPAVRQLIEEKKFLPGGRTLSNRGRDNHGSLFNCYSRGFIEDDYDDIMQAGVDIGKTFKAQGGQGVSLSKLRPKGAPIGDSYTSDGIIPFMKIYNEITAGTSQGGSRKGALMISLDARHAEAMDFITVKSGSDIIEKANLSLEVDDEFMEAVKKFYETGEQVILHEKRDYSGHVVEYDVAPIKVFNAMVDNCYDWGDPACLFVNRFRHYNLMEFVPDYKIETCNPCFDGNMELLTADGYRKFQDLCDQDVLIYNADGEIISSHVWCSGEKETVAVRAGRQTIICTPEHRFLTAEGEECMAQDLKGKRVMPFSHSFQIFNPAYVRLGFIQGDGQLSNFSSKAANGIDVNIGKKDTDIWDLFDGAEVSAKTERKIYVKGLKDTLEALKFSEKTLPEREFPLTYDEWNHSDKASFLQGCYSANGSIIKTSRVAYKTTCKSFAEKLKTTLMEDFELQSVYITTNKEHDATFANGTYKCKESYDVNIGGLKDLTRFAACINFYQRYKKEQLRQLLIYRAPLVTSVVPAGVRKVYDFSEPKTHWGIVEGVVVHNCGEQPLIKNGACCLSSINLSEFVLRPYTKEACFSFSEFADVIPIAIRCLDDLIEENYTRHPLKAQQEMSYNYRNIGLGCFGYATMLMKLGIEYGSDRCIEFTETLFKIMFRTAVLASIQLAKERGNFPKYDERIWDATILKNAFSEDEIASFRREGHLRNCSLLSIAPNGSLATLLGESGGCEPEFAIKYTRRTVGMTDGQDHYYDVYCKAGKEYRELHPEEAVLPACFVSSQGINPLKRVKVQATMQRYIDTAISSTVNLPQSATKEDVAKIYLSAWESGCKGITIFRDGCKKIGILTTSESESGNKEEAAKTLQRGDIIKCSDDMIGKKRKLMTGCGSLHCEAFFDPETGDLMETFFSKGSTGGCNSFMVGLSRMISLAARSGCDFDSIIDQLNSCITCPSYAVRKAVNKDTSPGNCCPAAIGKALKEMHDEMLSEIGEVVAELKVAIKPETKDKPIAQSKDKCPECGEPLEHVGGCATCPNCGWSRCG